MSIGASNQIDRLAKALNRDDIDSQGEEAKRKLSTAGNRECIQQALWKTR
jgi:hypothetical protein